jgi:hypothetical protein
MDATSAKKIKEYARQLVVNALSHVVLAVRISRVYDVLGSNTPGEVEQNDVDVEMRTEMVTVMTIASHFPAVFQPPLFGVLPIIFLLRRLLLVCWANKFRNDNFCKAVSPCGSSLAGCGYTIANPLFCCPCWRLWPRC